MVGAWCDFQLNKGIYIDDREILFADIPESSPSLFSHGYAAMQDIGGGKLFPPYILVYCDLEAGTVPFAELEAWGYVAPPPAPAVGELLSDWQRIGKFVVQDMYKPSLALIPVTGFDRFACIVTSVAGTPVSVRMRMRGISEKAANFMINSGLVSGGLPQGRTIADVTDGVDGTYYYYINTSDKINTALQVVINGGTAGAGPTGVTVTVEGTLQDDGTAPGSCVYNDITITVFGAVSLNAAPGASNTAFWVPILPSRVACTKYLRVKVVAQTNGPNTGDWLIFERSV